MSAKIRWGLWGTSAISASFAEALRGLPGAELVAVGSRSEDRASRFAAQHGAGRAYGSRDALLADPGLDVIYVASPNAAHEEDVRAAIAAKKAVLCEKPLCTSAAAAERLAGEARAAGVFLMEAMWTRFFPLIAELEGLLARGEIGELGLLEADFGFAGDRIAEPRIFDPRYGGGAILDVGVYPLWFAHHLLGPPRRVQAGGRIGPSGVEESVAILLEHERGAISVLSASIAVATASTAVLGGSRGHVRLESPWWRPRAALVCREGEADRRIDAPFMGNGYAHEALEVMGCLARGERESARHPLSASIEVLRTADRVRALVGLASKV